MSVMLVAPGFFSYTRERYDSWKVGQPSRLFWTTGILPVVFLE